MPPVGQETGSQGILLQYVLAILGRTDCRRRCMQAMKAMIADHRFDIADGAP